MAFYYCDIAAEVFWPTRREAMASDLRSIVCGGVEADWGDGDSRVEIRKNVGIPLVPYVKSASRL